MGGMFFILSLVSTVSDGVTGLAARERQIYFDRKILHVIGKGNKIRFVPIGSKSIIVLQDYINQCENMEKNSFLLTNIFSKVFSCIIPMDI